MKCCLCEIMHSRREPQNYFIIKKYHLILYSYENCHPAVDF